MRFKNVFCTQLYKDTFSKVLKEDEFTHGDEILVDMEEPEWRQDILYYNAPWTFHI